MWATCIVPADATDLLRAKGSDGEDEQELDFEAGTDEHPDDDSDLLGEDEAQPQGAAAVVKNGDHIEFAGDSGVARIDLKTGMILIETADLETVDFRPATAEEIEAEHERNTPLAVS